MKLYIAEKPSVAQAIADVLGGGTKTNGFIDLPNLNTKITWCYGHLLEQEQPEFYVDGGKVLAEHLPVIPDRFKLSPREKAAPQVKVIKDLLKEADEVINAGDADREGQLLVDELFPVLGWKGKTSRLWLSSLDEESVRLALLKVKPNEQYQKLYESALGRQRADWLVSLNCSIALSRNLQAMAVPGAWSLGRVQTPTLALVVDRANAIKNFSKRDHYQVKLEVGADDKHFAASWEIPDDLLIDGLLLDKAQAEKVAVEASSGQVKVLSFEVKPGTRAAPMPFTLGTLQTAASQKLGFSASETLAAAQALYEAKVTTYPRTDCAYLPVEIFDKAPDILNWFVHDSLGIDPKRKHAAWNTSKVEAHHGIVPTGVDPASKNLGQKELKLFAMILDSFIRLFMKPEAFETREARLESNGSHVFIAKSRTVVEPGWTKFSDSEDTQTSDLGNDLPQLTVGQDLGCIVAEVVAKQTTPPKPYTDGTLIAAMKSVHKLVTDPQLKARLKETSGLGTEATRAGMIETIIARGYVERRKKDLVPTERGFQLIGWLRSDAGTALLTDPGATALQEDLLADIEAGRLIFSEFIGQVVQSAKDLCGRLLAGKFVSEASLNFKACPACGGGRCAQLTSKAGNPYFSCLDCKARFANDGGAPGKQFEESASGERKPPAPKGPTCKSCKTPTISLKTKTDKSYFRCTSCGSAWWPDRDSPKKLGALWAAKS